MPPVSRSYSGLPLRRCLLIVLIALVPSTLSVSAASQSFDTGSLIIPMDTDAQDQGMLRAYGLVYALLRHGIPVHWTIEPAKVWNGIDFSVSSGLEDVRSGAAVSSPRDYRGGPFVVAAADAGTALPIVQAWQAVPGDTTAVHRLTAGSFTAWVDRTLRQAPRIAVLEGGNEQIALRNLNAAGIPDSGGNAWGPSSPDLLAEPQVIGGAPLGDGALFHGTGLPRHTRYCQVYSMHHLSTASTPAVIEELRAWLDDGELTHAFLQCHSAMVFENGDSGRFLTSNGFQDDGQVPGSVFHYPSAPASQSDGPFDVDGGVPGSLSARPGGHLKTFARPLMSDSHGTLERMVHLTGRLDGDLANGQVTYLTGHDYSVTLPISSSPQTNGVRLFLNALLAADCATEIVQADVDLSLSAPALINGSQFTYRIAYTNPGPRPVENVTVMHSLPPGAGFVSASGAGTHASGTVTWSIGPLAPLESGSLEVTVDVVGDASYVSTAWMDFAHLAVRRIRSNTVTTVRDATPPAVAITAGPSGETSDSTPTFAFTADGAPGGATCRVDGDPFASCTSPYTVQSALSPGPHTFEVSAADEAGNIGSDTRAFDVADPVSFTGFFAPVDNPPVMNVVNAGRSVPLTWRLTDGNGNPVTTLARVDVTTTTVPCGLGGADPVPEDAAGGSGLQNLGDGYYRFNWKTERGYAGACRAFTLDLGDSMGGEHVLLFQFVK